jgi:glycosyltransferase involved in cell wall biosynthesis
VAIRVLWMSDSPTLCTGFATVTREVLHRLAGKPGFEVAAVGWGYDGWPYDRAQIPYDIYPSQASTYGRDSAAAALDHFRPDILVSFGDLWMVDWVKDLPRSGPWRSVLYFPVDGWPFPPAWRPTVEAADAAVAYSGFGQALAQQACPGSEIELIYHGVDTAAFRPLPSKEEVKRRHGLAGKFVVGCVARNQPRKNLPILLKAFAAFARSRPDAVLYLHTDPDDIGWDLIDLPKRLGIAGRTYITRAASVAFGVRPEKLNEIYNLFDVMALPTAGEGFGLPILEAMAAGTPVIATKYSACIELLEGRGELIEVKELLTVGRFNVEQAVPDADDLVRKLALLYEDEARRVELGRLGREFARQFDWDFVLEQWEELLPRIAARAPRAGTIAAREPAPAAAPAPEDPPLAHSLG